VFFSRSLDGHLPARHYFVVAHFILYGLAHVRHLPGTTFWFPKMFGRMMNETLGSGTLADIHRRVNCVFMPMHYLGLAGNVRRYSAFTDDYLSRSSLHRFITIAALFTGAVQLIFLYNLIRSRLRGPWRRPTRGKHDARVVYVSHAPRYFGAAHPWSPTAERIRGTGHEPTSCRASRNEHRHAAAPADTAGRSVVTGGRRAGTPRRRARCIGSAIGTVSMSFAASRAARVGEQRH